jgi:hypothetical protein
MITLIGKDDPEFPHKTLRHATLDDIPWIITEASKEFQESPYIEFGVNRAKARQLLEKLIIEGQENGVVLLSYDGSKIVGCLAAYAFSPLFSTNRIATECLWFLSEEYRKTARGLDMMKAYEYWAKLVGCTHVQYGLLSTSPERMKSLYDRTGAKMTEQIFTKRLD